MAHVRGAQEDFRAWSEITGTSRWSYQGLLPAFRRTESFSGGASQQHGDGGPLAVLLPDAELSPVVRAYMAAGLEAGIPWLGDHNTGRLIGVAPNSLTIRAGRRVTAADAYLAPALARGNLTVISRAMVHRLALSGMRVTGLTANIHGQLTTPLGSTVERQTLSHT
jgi:pyridoxine 4-oxidase